MRLTVLSRLVLAAVAALPASAQTDAYRAAGPVSRPVQTTAPRADGPGPRFSDMRAVLPGPQHVYGGGWEHFVGGGVAVFDCDGDARPDLLAAGGAEPTTAYRNVTPPGGELAFATLAIAPLDGVTGITGAYPLDIDSDGAMDLFVLRAGPNMALRGDGACGFRDATADWGIAPGNAWSTAFTATWEPGADWPTLAIGNYVNRDDPDGPFEACDDNVLLRPVGSGYAGPVALSPGFCALSALFSDWSRQGRADLRLSNDRHYYVRGGSEQMWRLSPLRLLGPQDGWRPISIWGMGIASRDLNNDGRPDVMLTSMGDQLLQYATDTAGYVDAPWGTGSHATRPHVGDDGRPSTGWHAQFGDVDNDGLADLFIAKGNVDQMPDNAMRDPNNLLMGRPDGTFAEASVAAGIASTDRARGAALADLDGDGRLDLVVVNRRAPLELWRNVTPDTGAWLALTPRQAGPNTHAVGAWIEARRPDGTVVVQERTVGGGHAGGQAGPLHFGLGAADSAEIRITWPDGAVSDWLSLPARQAVTLWRDGARLAARSD
jgi:hypothetical protein